MDHPQAKVVLEDAGIRVQSMKMLYEKLYEAPAFTEIPVKDYIPALVDAIIANFPKKDMVRTEKDIEDFSLPTQVIQPLGIIVNELLTNIMKYAIVGKNSGLIIVSLKHHNGLVSLIVRDDGNGMPENMDFSNTTGFGLRPIKAITEQLNSTIPIKRSGGTKFVLEFNQ